MNRTIKKSIIICYLSHNDAFSEISYSKIYGSTAFSKVYASNSGNLSSYQSYDKSYECDIPLYFSPENESQRALLNTLTVSCEGYTCHGTMGATVTISTNTGTIIDSYNGYSYSKVLNLFGYNIDNAKTIHVKMRGYYYSSHGVGTTDAGGHIACGSANVKLEAGYLILK